MKLFRNIFKYAALSMVFLVFVTACTTEDFTGHSTVKPSSPTITVTGAGSYTSNEAAETKYDYTVSIDKLQVSDVYVYATVTEGTAVDGVNYSLSASKIVIPANSLSAPFSVQILSTTTPNETLTFKLQIGDERTGNASVTPSMSDFTITNASDDMLVAGMSWDTNIESAAGVEMDPEDAVDMRMLIVDASDLSIVDIIDGGSFEEYDEFNTLADGDYLIAADIYATVDLGDINVPLSLSLELEFNQLGTISHMILPFPDVMTNDFTCDAYRTYLATVTVASGSYTIVKSVSYLVPQKEAWSGDDVGELGYTSEVETVAGCDFLIFGLGHQWMLDFWGEEVIAEGNVVYTIDPDTDEVTIEEQYYITTLYDGSEYPYTIVGSGTYDDSGPKPTMTINYDMIQDGFSTAGWTFTNGYITTPLFVATITLP